MSHIMAAFIGALLMRRLSKEQILVLRNLPDAHMKILGEFIVWPVPNFEIPDLC